MRGSGRSTVTIRDVAAHAGVSRMTVSRVINASGQVTAETRARIEASIAATGYRPDPVARQLALGRREGPVRPERRIGVVYPADGARMLGELLAASMDCADRAGMRLVPVPLGQQRDRERLTTALESAACDGLLLLPGSEAMVEEILESIPAVAISPALTHRRVTAIRIDDYGSAQHLAEQLLLLGHRQIGFLAAAFGRESERAHERGVLDTLRGSGVSAWVERSAQRSSGAARLAALTLLRNPDRPTVIVAANDELALACLAAASELGIVIPHDVVLCSCGDSTIGGIDEASLPAAEMCRTAFQLLNEQIGRRESGTSPPPIAQILMLRAFAPSPPPAEAITARAGYSSAAR